MLMTEPQLPSEKKASRFGQPLEALPPWPLYETIVGTLLVIGAIYYALAIRGRAADVEPDLATGEATIG